MAQENVEVVRSRKRCTAAGRSFLVDLLRARHHPRPCYSNRGAYGAPSCTILRSPYSRLRWGSRWHTSRR